MLNVQENYTKSKKKRQKLPNKLPKDDLCQCKEKGPKQNNHKEQAKKGEIRWKNEAKKEPK